MAQCGFAARFKTEGGLAKNIGRDGLNHGIGPFVLGADCGGRWRIEWPRTNRSV